MKIGDIAIVRNRMVANQLDEGKGIITKIELCDVYQNINKVWVLLSSGQYDWFYDVDVEVIDETNVESCV
jgi:hypothetical protein|tara:strand:- start:998 stop:1207 length:210 start_codon:yes stop_codon:yes gene_type:complete